MSDILEFRVFTSRGSSSLFSLKIGGLPSFSNAEGFYGAASLFWGCGSRFLVRVTNTDLIRIVYKEQIIQRYVNTILIIECKLLFVF